MGSRPTKRGRTRSERECIWPVGARGAVRGVPGVRTAGRCRFTGRMRGVLGGCDFGRSMFTTSVPFVRPAVRRLLCQLVQGYLGIVTSRRHQCSSHGETSRRRTGTVVRFLTRGRQCVPRVWLICGGRGRRRLRALCVD